MLAECYDLTIIYKVIRMSTYVKLFKSKCAYFSTLASSSKIDSFDEGCIPGVLIPLSDLWTRRLEMLKSSIKLRFWA